jgi:hypothetical protein
MSNSIYTLTDNVSLKGFPTAKTQDIINSSNNHDDEICKNRGCFNFESSKMKSRISVSPDKKKNLLSKLKIPRKNDRLQYLIMVDTKDLKSTWYSKSKKDMLVNHVENLRGKVHWGLIESTQLDKCECCKNNQLEIKGMVELYTIYVHLPKENKYVEFDEWENDYTKSRLGELITIFTLLGAKSLVINLNKNSNNQSKKSGELSVNEVGIDVGVGYQVEKSNDTTDSIGYKIKLEGINLDKLREMYPNTESFIDNNTHLYYLYNNSEWISYIEQRLLGGAKTMDCKYNHKKILKASMKLKLKMEKVGISISSCGKERRTECFEINVKFPEFIEIS